MLSYWEKENFIKYDLIVIGGGIVGLSTAIQYRKMFPSRKILLLERGIFPSGASSRNAGFACFGSLTEILDDLENMEESEVYALVERRYKGLLAIRNVFGDKALGYQPTHGFELITDKELPALDYLSRVNQLLFPIFNQEVFQINPQPQSFGFGEKVLAIVENRFEGALDSGKFLNSLWEKSNDFQIKIITGATVSKILPEEKIVLVKENLSGEEIRFEARDIAVCTNAFTAKLLENLDVRPGRGMILMTAPILKKIPWKGTFHYDKGYVYFRKLEKRLMIGGGRNFAFEEESTLDFGINPLIKNYLLSVIKEIIFPGYVPQIEMEWSGIMAFGPNKKPIVEMPYPHVGVAARLGGMGVAVGWQTGRELVSLFEKV